MPGYRRVKFPLYLFLEKFALDFEIFVTSDGVSNFSFSAYGIAPVLI